MTPDPDLAPEPVPESLAACRHLDRDDPLSALAG